MLITVWGSDSRVLAKYDWDAVPRVGDAIQVPGGAGVVQFVEWSDNPNYPREKPNISIRISGVASKRGSE